MKLCSKCGRDETETSFSPSKYTKCNECHAAYLRSYRALNVERTREIAKAWREANPDKAEASWKKWKSAHPDKIREYNKNPAHSKKYRESHRSQFNAYMLDVNRRRRAVKLSVDDGTITASSWRELCDFFGNKCLVCGSSELTMDHIIPLSRGGAHSIHNVQPLCGTCNRKKHAKVIDYRSQKGRVK